MDIARIRKKLRESGWKKTLEGSHKEPPEEAAKAENIKPTAVQETAETLPSAQPQIIVGYEAAQILTDADNVSAEEIEILAFNVADEEYAVRTAEIQEILQLQRISFVPRAPRYLKGITSVRGKILPVIDLKERLGLKNENKGKLKIIILRTANGTLGVLVGAVLDVLRFSETELLQPPPTLSDDEKNLITGVVRIKNRFISILNVNEI